MNLPDKIAQQIVNGAFEPKNWQLTKGAKKVLYVGSGLIVGSLIIGHLIKKILK